MFMPTLPVWELIARGAIVFVAVLVLLRVFGKRQVGQMTPFDLAVLLLISEGASNAIRADDHSITAAIVVVATMLGINLLIGFVGARSKAFDRLVEGTPEILIRDGRVDYEKLWTVNVSKADLLTALREHECTTPHEAELAVLETNGHISVKKKAS
ncbi:MAG: DUF421 domain-containing protein [Alphaproteobacteria bacterium]|nr:DUF421 domain-containing protein [Alphaproteobacteria bacterium]MCW5741509.1 DUF421 domain-containing protein [Alphaproteobacteria bacterium]